MLKVVFFLFFFEAIFAGKFGWRKGGEKPLSYGIYHVQIEMDMESLE